MKFNPKNCHKLITGNSTQSQDNYNSIKRRYIKVNVPRTYKHYKSQSRKPIALNNKGYPPYIDKLKLNWFSKEKQIKQKIK